VNQLKKCRYGEVLYQPNDSYIGRSFDLYGEFSEGEVALFRELLKPGDTAVDVGASIGAHTVPLARLVGSAGRVAALEPQRLAYYCLCANVALNNLHHVVCHHAAAGAAAGTLVVPAFDPDAELNFGGLSLFALPAGVPGQEVPVRPIDDLLLPACHLLKIDVEGMERQVLAGAAQTIRRHRPFLYVEDDRPDLSAELRADLDALGYVLYFHRPRYFNPDNFFHNPTNIFGDTVSLNLYGHPREAASPVDPQAFGMVRLTGAPSLARSSDSTPAQCSASPPHSRSR
jgi:FkbM family methyltransferase